MNRERAMQKRKQFGYKGFGHIACHCRNRRDIEENGRAEFGRLEYQPSSNKFKFLTSNVMQTEIPIKEKKKKKKVLRKVIVKIGLKQEEEEEGITVEVLLDSRVTELVMSLQSVRKNKFKKKMLDKPII